MRRGQVLYIRCEFVQLLLIGVEFADQGSGLVY